MEGIYNEHANLGGAGAGFGGGFGFSPVIGGGFGLGAFGGGSDLIGLIIALKALDRLDGHGNDHCGHGRGGRDCITKDDLIQQTLGSLKGDVKENKADILAAIIDGKCDVKDSITSLQGLLSGEFRDLSGKLCDFKHDTILQAFQTRVDIKDSKCDLENKIDKSKDYLSGQLRDMKDDLDKHFCKLREGQLQDKIDELREKLNRDKTVNDIFDKLREDRHFRGRGRGRDWDDDCGFSWPRRWPTASVPAEVQAPLFAFSESNPCDNNGPGNSLTKKS